MKEWISTEEASESESNVARTAKRSNGESGGSQRTASMYLCSGRRWITGRSDIAGTAIAKGLEGFSATIAILQILFCKIKKRWEVVFFVTEMPLDISLNYL